VEGVRGRAPFVPGWDAAVRNVRGLEAAVRSAAAGGAVAVEPGL
jgi:hypothetical protein